jgi:subfamily B ATP-binding cassette protein MsbA
VKDFSRLLRYAKPYWPALAASVIFMAVVGLSQGLLLKLIPLVFERVLDPRTPDKPALLFSFPFKLYLNQLVPGFVTNIWTMVAFGIVMCFFAKGACDYLGNYLVNWVGISAVMDLRQEVFEQVLRQDANFFERQGTGQMMSHIMGDIQMIQTSVSNMLADWLRQMFTAVFILLVMVTTDWKLSMISLMVLPVVALLTMRLGRRIRRTTRNAQNMAADLNQILQETITGHHVVKGFGAEAFESNRFRVAAKKLKTGSLQYVAQQAIASPLIEFLGASSIVLLLWIAREQAKQGSMTPGKFTGFVLALVMLYEPVKRLTGIHNIFQQGVGAAMKVFGYLDAREGVRDRPNALALPKFERNIVFQNVLFAYPGAQQRIVLKGINLEVKAGEIVALVGPSGAGKTTLANLVPRVYDVTGGSVRIDGKDVRDIGLSALLDKISIVWQETFLFNDTVFNNIAYGRRYARPEDVYTAAKAALADEFVKDLPEQYDTLIGERGSKLSGGQRQRIAIARALLKDAPILILDEATSNLDTNSERLVQQALTILMERRTVIVIAHRLSTIRRADKIVVLDEGEVAEVGTHDTLMGKKGIYHRLHELQHVDSHAIRV